MANRNPSILAPNSSAGGLYEVMSRFLENRSRDMHTGIPAVVIEVNYDKAFVKVQPLIKTKKEPGSDTTEFQYPQIDEVPIYFGSGNRGKARLSFPIKAGDSGVLLFSERSIENYLNSDGVSLQDSGNYLGLGLGGVANPMVFFPETFTSSAARRFSSENIVLENEKAITTHKSDGTIESKNDSITSVINPDGSGSISNGSGFITLQADGVVNINGFIISPSGAASSPVSVSAPSMVVDGKELDDHTHSAGSLLDSGSGACTGNTGSNN